MTEKIHEPRSTDQARELAERFARIDLQIQLIEATRNEAIGAANARADAEGAPLMAERDVIVAKLRPWWTKNGVKLTEGERKSIELGGCEIGSRAGRDSLAIDGDEKAIVKTLEKHDWARPLLKVKTTLDKVAILKSIDGVYKTQLKRLGLSRKEGEETFFVKRTEQGGTLSSIGAGAGK